MKKYIKHALGLYMIFTLGFCIEQARADFKVMGPFEATACKGFIIEFCTMGIIVDAIIDKNGKLFSLPQNFQTVDEYSSSQKRCWNTIKNSIFNKLIINNSDFYQFNSGPRDLLSSYKKIENITTITFRCEKQ
jgi:hypothetical protein